MRSPLLTWALCGALLFAPVARAQEGAPERCEPALAAESQTPQNRTTQWAVGLGLTCTLVGGTYVACRVLSENHEIRTAFFGALIALGIQQGLTLARRFVGPQMDFIDQWLVKLGYSTNHWVVQWLLGKSPRTNPLGDSHSPNHNVDINARLSLQQQQTASKIGSVLTHLDWLGLRLPELLNKGQVDEAAAQLVSNVVMLSYADQEIIVRTSAPHVDPMTQQLILLAADGYLFKKLAPIFNADPSLIPRFNAAVQKYLTEAHAEAPLAFFAYRNGVEIVLKEWLADAIRKHCNQDFCVEVPGKPE